MRMINVQYIPLKKLKPDGSYKMNKSIQKLRNLMLDCMYIVAVKKNKKSGKYIVVSGHDRYEYLKNHTTNKYVPCIVDEGKISKGVKSLIHRFPGIDQDQLVPASVKIIQTYIKQDPRFFKLPYSQQLRVLLLALRYKRTVINSMKARVDEWSAK
ncbi:hypothetical protein [Ammoniphilus resinae]|uniref:ParB/Sulfiredoxin domain-containing protein n=1 Tax=Ammoniphilus resinae TaxID=861532 RepID=A0ABS4GIY2_9BACL|nr:hypothetical protein [Ammoniphilus resinae]MBP1930184.1 hypothetical protein [Ammoniphilus resinae]